MSAWENWVCLALQGLHLPHYICLCFHDEEHLCLQDVIKCETIKAPLNAQLFALVSFRWLKRSVSKIWMCLGLMGPDLQIWIGINHQSPPDAACWTGSSGGMWVCKRTRKQQSDGRRRSLFITLCSAPFLSSTRRCPFPTAVYSLPASTLWTPCPTLPPSGAVVL